MDPARWSQGWGSHSDEGQLCSSHALCSSLRATQSQKTSQPCSSPAALDPLLPGWPLSPLPDGFDESPPSLTLSGLHSPETFHPPCTHGRCYPGSQTEKLRLGAGKGLAQGHSARRCWGGNGTQDFWMGPKPPAPHSPGRKNDLVIISEVSDTTLPGWVQISFLLCTHCVTSGKSSNLSEPQFCHLQNGELNKLIEVKCLEQGRT